VKFDYTGIEMPGVELIATERQRQMTKEGWTHGHDDAEHYNSELLQASKAYIISAEHGRVPVADDTWPWDDGFKPTTPIRDLVKSGALIAAEIDRRLRSGEKP